MKFTFAVTTAFALLTSVCASAIPSIEERTVPSTVDNLPDADVYCKDSSGNCMFQPSNYLQSTM